MSCSQLTLTQINALIPGSGLQQTSAPWGTTYLNSLNTLTYTSTVDGYPQAGILGKINYGLSPSSVSNNPNLSSISFPDNTSNNNDANTYKAAINSYITELNNEYCFYYNIYLHGIKTLLDDIVLNSQRISAANIASAASDAANTSVISATAGVAVAQSRVNINPTTSNNATLQDRQNILRLVRLEYDRLLLISQEATNLITSAPVININAEKAIVVYMNLRCRQLLQYMVAIQTSLDTNSNSMTTGASLKNTELNKVNTTLQEQNEKLTANNLNGDVLQEMVAYTYEKNRYSSNLLALYGGLNIIAIALLVYIYRS